MAYLVGDINGPTRDYVFAQGDYLKGLANNWVTLSQQSLQDLSALQIAPMTFEVPVDLTVDYGTFTRPAAPVAPTVPTVSVTLPTAPSLSDVVVPTISDEPVSPDFSGALYSKPAAPNVPLPSRPSDLDVVLTDVVVPDAPTYTLPTEPDQYRIELPAVPDLTVPAFDGVRPTMNLEAPTQTFAWAADPYDNSFINTIKSSLTNMIQTGLALPAAIQQAIFDQNRGREDILSLKAMQEGTDGLAASGVRQPAGMLQRIRDRLLADSRQRSSASSRELSIGIATQTIESIRDALGKGISLEVALVQANTANNELALRAATAAQQVAIDLFNAKVALHNAQWEGYKADAQVFLSRIEALQAQADVYKSQIDAQKVIGDVNESLVRAYGEKMRAVGILVDIYKTNLDAARAKGELNTQKLEQVRLRLQAYDTDINAWGKLQDGYRTAVEAELGNVRAFETLGNLYGRRVDAWKTRNEAYFEQGRFKIETQAQQLERYKALLQGAEIDGRTQLAAADAVLRTYATQGTVYAAEAQVSATEAQAADRSATLRMESARLRIETGQKNLELTANYALKAIDAQIAQLEAKAKVVSQLAASTLSGMNFGATVSAGTSEGVSWSRSKSWNGNVTDETELGF